MSDRKYAMLGVEYHVMLRRDPGDTKGVWQPTTIHHETVIVRVEDEGAGPYLVVRGRLTDFDPSINKETDIIVCDERDVDNLADALKRILREHATAEYDKGKE